MTMKKRGAVIASFAPEVGFFHSGEGCRRE
jgi:hypothetical protein